MVKDDFEFNYKKEEKKRIVLSDEQIGIIIKVVFFALLAIGLIGVGVFFPFYIDIYCWIIGTLFVVHLMVMAQVGITGSAVLRAVSIILIIGFTFGISIISNRIFMYHNLRNGGKEFIKKIDKSGNYSISIISNDSKNKRKKFVIDNSNYLINPIYGDKEFFIKKDGKYVLYVNNHLSKKIKDINIKQQDDIKLEKINKSSNQNEDDGLFYFLLIAGSVGIFILLGSCKL